MSFRTRRIREKQRWSPVRKFKRAFVKISDTLANTDPKHRSYVIGTILILIATMIVFKVMAGAYYWVKNFNARDLIFAAGAELKKDDFGYTNIVLLGDGGHERDGADLIDTIMVASLDHEKNAITLLSVPRDYYTHGHGVRNGRINELYRNNKNNIGESRAFALFQDVAGEMTGLTIHYYMRIDFNAFVEGVDTLGGIEMNVPDSIYDPYYPNETDNGYITFKIEKGMQYMDGETALKYVRSRKTTSDFDRAARQQLVLTALREKALTKGVLNDAETLKELYGTVQKNINTNLSLREMISLARFAESFDRSHLVTRVLHDDPGQNGGFLYTPERQYYDGQFVLVPFGDNLDLIHHYSNFIFHKREAFYVPRTIDILNATKTSGIARNAAYQMNRFGFSIDEIDNLKDANKERSYSEKTIIRYYDWHEDSEGNKIPDYSVFISAIQDFVRDAELVPADPTLRRNGISASIILGNDYNVFLVN
jgi:LCP family protein required for cell wall assembly